MQNITKNFESLSTEEISKYSGEWIAVINGTVVIHSKTFEEVYSFVKKNFPNDAVISSKEFFLIVVEIISITGIYKPAQVYIL